MNLRLHLEKKGTVAEIHTLVYNAEKIIIKLSNL
jgi:hypothetical protein